MEMEERNSHLRKRVNSAVDSVDKMGNGDAGGGDGRLRADPVVGLSVDSVCEAEKKKFLDFKDLNSSRSDEISTYPAVSPEPPPPAHPAGDPSADKLQLLTAESDSDSDKDEEENSHKKKKNLLDAYRPSPKMNTLAGFLRLANYVCASAVSFGLAVSLFYPLTEEEIAEEKALRAGQVGFAFWQDAVYQMTGWVQVCYLAAVSVLVLVDAVATRTFRWKEYGELTHCQTDASSIIFLLYPSRWTFRLGAGLVMATASSLRTTRIIQLERFSPHDHAWYFGLTLVGAASAVVGYLFSLSPWHGVSWLNDRFKESWIEDRGDVWDRRKVKKQSTLLARSRNASSSSSSSSASSFDSIELEKKKGAGEAEKGIMLGCSLSLPCAVHVASRLVFLSSFLAAFAFHLAALIWTLQDRGAGKEKVLEETLEDVATATVPRKEEDEGVDLEVWTVVAAFVACQLINLGALVYMVLSMFARKNFICWVPTLLKLAAPFTVSSAVRCLLEVKASAAVSEDAALAEEAERLFALKATASYVWAYSVALMALSAGLQVVLKVWPLDEFAKSAWHFVWHNFFAEEGVNKKVVRVLDTLGSCSALVALVLGIYSVFADQYDLDFTPDGFLKEVSDVIREFEENTKEVTLFLKTLIETLDAHFTCDDLYAALGTGVGVTLVAGFFPGAASIASASTRSSYYYVRAANALTNLAQKLRRSKNALWQLARAVRILAKLTTGSIKAVWAASNFAILIRMLPFMPPVVIGMYVLFGAFWPHRILFFSGKQRRRTMADELYTWILALVLLSVAIAVNTALVDEIVEFMDENIPLARVSVERKLGWKVSAAAFAFAYLSVLSFVVSTFILKVQTFANHENLTNEELDWKYEIEKRELVRIKTAIGVKLEKRTQIKYKKERIGPWNWVLPILLCALACFFGYLANVNPKFEFQLEPKGALGRVVDRVYRKMRFYENDMYGVVSDTERECLPYASFGDFLDDNAHVSNVLMAPVYKFYNKTEELVDPVRDVIKGMRKQLFLDVQEELFGDELSNIWNENHLQYLGMLLTVPRAVCLLILVFGCLTASIWVCQMSIIQSLEPKKIVSAYGKVALFSVLYVIGVQFALYSFLTSVGVPFYDLNLRFGLGFVYDVVADSILVSVYVGMKNQFFFAVPKRKTTVTYSVPGVSDGGPPVQGKIV